MGVVAYACGGMAMDHNDMSNRTKITATWVGCLRCIRFYICEFTDAMWYIGNQKKNHNPFATFDPEEGGRCQKKCPENVAYSCASHMSHGQNVGLCTHVGGMVINSFP